MSDLKLYHTKGAIEVGIDEAGRGCLMGRVYAGAVILPNEFSDEIYKQIRDSKKLTEKKRYYLKDYIEENAISFGIGFVDEKYIDTHNIYNATMKAMHLALDNLNIRVDRLLVDGNKFKPYYDNYDNYPSYSCIINGDSEYLSIASASILAKCYHDLYIKDLVTTDQIDDKYNWLNNKGYGTKKHLDAINEFGITEYHRKSFKPCQ